MGSEMCIRDRTFQDWELIVVDDGSEDETGDVVRRYCARDSRIHYVRQPHGGCARALNTGLRLVRGRYFFKMDDDDMALPDLLATSAAGLDAHPGHWALKFQFLLYRGNRNKGWTFDKTTFVSPLFFRVAALRAIKGWNETFKIGEDGDLFIRASLHHTMGLGRILHEEKPLYKYRKSNSNSGNVYSRVSMSENFQTQFMFKRIRGMARWGMRFWLCESLTMLEWVMMMSRPHGRNRILPSARFAHWHQPALEEIYAEIRPWELKMLLNSLKVRPRFPWVPLWKAERTLWQHLQLLRTPLMRRVEAMWDLARNHYFRREEAK